MTYYNTTDVPRHLLKRYSAITAKQDHKIFDIFLRSDYMVGFTSYEILDTLERDAAISGSKVMLMSSIVRSLNTLCKKGLLVKIKNIHRTSPYGRKIYPYRIVQETKQLTLC